MDNQSIVFHQTPLEEILDRHANNLLAKLAPLLNANPAAGTSKKDEPYITRKEAAKILRVSLVTLHGYTVNGMVPAYRVEGSRQLRFKETEVRQSLQKIQTV